jgi:hypothetical protein
MAEQKKTEPVILYCRHAGCGVGYGSAGEVPATCPSCGGPSNWTTRSTPRVPYDLNHNDRRFLRSIRVVGD